MDNKWNFVNPPPAPDLKWGIYIEERIGMSPVSYRLFGYDDPAEAWACLLTALERSTRNRIFYVKERGQQQRWTEFRETTRHLFRQTRRRYYLGYEDFLYYAAGKPCPKRQQRTDEDEPEVDTKLLTEPNCAVEDAPAPQSKGAASQLFEVKSVWRHMPPIKRRL